MLTKEVHFRKKMFAYIKHQEKKESKLLVAYKIFILRVYKKQNVNEFIKEYPSEIRNYNWWYLFWITLACALSGMQIGSAMFNDEPLVNIIKVQ